jgi:anti-sigma B factor antagonist
MSDAMFTTRLVGGVPVVAAPEDIDFSNAAELRAALLAAAEQRHKTLVVDMSRTVFCDTAGLHVLVIAHKRALAEGGEVRVVIPGSNVLRIFSITGIDRVLPRFATVAKALAAEPAAGTDRPQPASP